MNYSAFVYVIGVAFVCIMTGCVNVITDASSHEQTLTQKTTQVVNRTNVSSTVAHGDFLSSLDSFYREMCNRRKTFATGWTPETNVWIISIQNVRLSDGMDENQAAEMAMIRSKKKISEFLGTSISAHDKVSSMIQTINGTSVAKEYFESASRIDINQFLRGVMLHKQEVKDGTLHAVFFVTGKMADASIAFEKQLRATPPGIVRAVGFGLIVDKKIAPAKRNAVQSALRNAVEQVMGTMVIGQSQLMDNEKLKSKVLSQTAGHVKQYRIVKENSLGQNYQVILNAEIDEKTLLDNYSSIVRSMGNPGFFVETVDPDLHTALSGFLSDLGFLVTTVPEEAQFQLNADCKYLTVEDEQYGKGIQIDLALRLYDIAQQQQLISIGNVPRLTSTYSGTYHQIRQSAARKAFKTMRTELHKKMNKVVMDWILNGHNVSVIFHDCPGDTKIIKILEDSISAVPCAKVHTKNINGDIVSFMCSYVGASADFEYFLQERLKKDLPSDVVLPKTTQVNISKLELRFN